ncbi:MAG: ABC transporter permease [Planctomycetes bacterium]|nr:ABC transporter permease [Planctomycetota bacterium]
MTLVSGRPARSGEAIVGRLAAARLGVPASALAAGAILDVEGMPFRVVGEFAAGGSALEGEIWLPLHELRTALRRDDVSAVFVRMRSDADFAALELFARRRLDLESEAMRSSEFFERLARTYAPIGWMARVLASLVALAALVCGINVLSAAIAQRSGEIAVLRAIGYGPIAIAGGLALEAALVAGAGAALGLLLADVALAGQSIRVAMTAIELESSARSSAIALCATFALALGALIPAAYGSLTVPLATRLRGDG